MSTFQGHRVSREWAVILNYAVSKGVRFTLDDGQRTLAEQAQRVRDHGVWSPSNPHGAALPSPTAPHIKTGHVNHAIDVNSLDGGEQRLQNFLWSIGLKHAINNVLTEAWHIDPTDEAELKAVAARIAKANDYITLGAKGRKQLGLKKSLRKLGYLKGFYLGPFGKPAVAALKRFQHDHKLVADGVAGPLTLEAIKAALRRKGKRR